MRALTATARTLGLIFAAVALAAATLAPSAGAARAQKVDVEFEQLQGFHAPGSEDAEEFLNRHLLTGGFESFDLSRCERVKTIGGQTLPVSDGGTRIGGAGIVRANVPCTNGVIHVLDAEPQPAPAS